MARKTIGKVYYTSPSVWREWIEMIVPRLTTQTTGSLPPCGGSGLKCGVLQSQFQRHSLPPCGGSGLKWISGTGLFCTIRSPSVWREWIEIQDAVGTGGRAVSPSVWREWIEMTAATGQAGMCPVSLRVEGVD